MTCNYCSFDVIIGDLNSHMTKRLRGTILI